MTPRLHPVAIVCAVLVACAGILSFAAFDQAATGRRDLLVYFGTYTNEKSRGVYVSRLDLASGALTPPELAVETPNPSYLAVHPSGDFLYAANEVRTFEGKEGGSVSAFAIDRTTGRLTALNQQSAVGRGPVYVVVDKTGRNVLVSNYGGGSVVALPIGTNGALAPASAFVQHTGSSVHPQRQRGPRAHSINLDPGSRFAYAADLGLDKVLIYRFDANADRSSRTIRRLPPCSPAPVRAISRFTRAAALPTSSTRSMSR